MITAKQARELSGPTFEERVEEQLEYADKNIRAAAEHGHRITNLANEFWTREGYNNTDLYKKAAKKLKELGYTVEFFYDCGGQFVNMYTIVKW